MSTWYGIFLGWNGVLWAAIALVFLWLVCHYGLRRGKEQDVKDEYKEYYELGQDHQEHAEYHPTGHSSRDSAGDSADKAS